ncbi:MULTISPECIES: AraC family transcriptional regulator [Cytobacillus]|nr:AraC family transcriptional regulator [Cytobacillus stercorigallinarum]
MMRYTIKAEGEENMSWVTDIQKALDYIEANLLEKLHSEEVAKQANTSPFHFQRTFAILTDMTLGEYIRRRRLTSAAIELGNFDEKIIDIALKYGYETPEAFTKAFKKQHHISPSEVKKYRGKLQLYQPLKIHVTLEGVEPMNHTIISKESFQVVGIRKNYSLENDENLKEIPKFWNQVNQDGTCERLLSLNNGSIKGLLGVCVDYKKQQEIEYWIAVNYDGDSTNFETITIPASTWAVFQVTGEMPQAMQHTWKQIFSEWFPTSGYRHAGTVELEVYPEGDSNRSDFYSEIWVPVIKEL